MTVHGPTPEQLRDVAESLGMSITEEEVDFYVEQMAGSVAAFGLFILCESRCGNACLFSDDCCDILFINNGFLLLFGILPLFKDMLKLLA